ncbi:hypothetical protein OE88DRAFT_1620397, partial [Heliocybe sulcata]
TDIGRKDIIIGLSYLREHNPVPNWQTEDLEFTRCPAVCAPQTMMIQDEDLDYMEIPHLEDLATDSYTQLNGDT